MIHSTSLRATGSEMPAATAVALLAPPLRRVSIAFLTSATSASDVCSAGACAGGADGGWASPVPVSRVPVAQALTVGAAPDAPGPSGGVGITAALLAVDLLPLSASLDFPAAGFFAADFALLAFAVTVDELLAPPRWALASAYWVIASRLAQASAATSADRYRVKAVPPSPGDNSPPSVLPLHATQGGTLHLDFGGKAMSRRHLRRRPAGPSGGYRCRLRARRAVAAAFWLPSPYARYQGFCTHQAPAPNAVIMHCSYEMKPQLVPPPPKP